jgi:hypothetical protein
MKIRKGKPLLGIAADVLAVGSPTKAQSITYQVASISNSAITPQHIWTGLRPPDPTNEAQQVLKESPLEPKKMWPKQRLDVGPSRRRSGFPYPVDHSHGGLTCFDSLTVPRKLSMSSAYQVGAADKRHCQQPLNGRDKAVGYPRSGLATHYGGCEDAGNNEPRKAFATSC